MYKVRNLANTIAQYKILNHLDFFYEELVKNLTLIELVDNNKVKIKDKCGDICYLILEENVLYVFDEQKSLCWQERID